MAVYVGISTGSKEISSIYIGKENSIKEVSDGYTYNGSSIVPIYSSKAEPGQTVFTSSGFFTVPKGITSVDVFLVGGGGSGGDGKYYKGGEICGGSGGGSGYTKTSKGVSVTPGKSYSIIVGAGGNASSSSDGGTSSAFQETANGGRRGAQGMLNGSSGVIYPNLSYGGSGGGINAWYYGAKASYNGPGSGGEDGSCGNILWYYSTNSNLYQSVPIDTVTGYGMDRSKYKYASGQGTTTRAFGESDGTLYAMGGSGGGMNSSSSPSNGTDNTGNGGAGRSVLLGGTEGVFIGGNGGSGIVIIRWGY